MKNLQGGSNSQSCTTSNRRSTSSSYAKTCFRLLALVGTLISLSQAQEITTSTIQSSKISTTYDGITKDKYVTYLQLDTNNGALVDIADSANLNTNQQYTIMMWFKPMSSRFGSMLSYAFNLKGSFQCYFTASNELMCESEEKCEKLSVDTTSVYQNQWAHLTVSGHPTEGSYLSIESNTESLDIDRKSYVILRQTAWGQKACVGSCDANYGFIGGIREFIYIQQYVSEETASRLKNHYFTWDKSFKAYYRFSENRFNQDEFRAMYANSNQGSSVLANISSVSLIGRDYIPNDICFPFNDYQTYMHFGARQNQINPLLMNDRWTPLQINYEYSMSIWINLSPDSCVSSNPTLARESCNLIKLDEVFMLYISGNNQAKFHFFALLNYYEFSSSSFFIPYDQWINIQMSMTHFGGYEIKTYDILGRLIDNIIVVKNMQEHRPNTYITLLSGFQGTARNFVLYKQKRTLPINVSHLNETIVDSNCLVYVKFQPKYMSEKALYNYAVNTGYKPLDFTLAVKPTFKNVQWSDFTSANPSSLGLITYPDKLFDGIACNDNSKTLMFNGKSSNLRATTPEVSKYLMGSTVEFWFKAQDSVEKTNYLLSIYAQSAGHEFFSIYGISGSLICAPFGMVSSSSPAVTFEDFTESNRQQYGWLHLVCQYEYQANVIGYLYSNGFEKTYTTSIAKSPNYIPADTYDIYMGNSKELDKGTYNFFAKELRFWSVKRSHADIAAWRFRQVNPKDFSNNILLTYIRMGEGSYDEYNFASAQNSAIQPAVTYDNIQYVQNSELVVCPQSTYYSEGRCYLNPFNLMIGTIFPEFNSTTSELHWVMSANYSSLINQTSLSQLNVQWETTDVVINSIIQTTKNNIQIRVPSNAFRDGDTYPIKLNVSNPVMTFDQVTTINFIPVSCRWFIVQGFTASSAYNHYQLPQSVQDISFTIVLQEQNNLCSSNTFYNQFVNTIGYQVSPPTEQMPVLNFNYVNNKTVIVTIPKAEQSKMPLHTDVKIIFTIFWTNSLYSSLLNPYTSSFQNVMYTINFDQQAQTVHASLTASNSVILQGEKLTLNASRTYLTAVPDSENQNGLTYSWICPEALVMLCNTVTSKVLDITYDDFVNQDGDFNVNYEFQVQVKWTQEGGKVSTYYASQRVTWYEIKTPAFSFYSPAPVTSTAESQKFQITFDNYDVTDLSDLEITWQIIPNLTLPSYFNLTANNTVLTVPAGGFAQLTNYSMYIQVTNKINPIATKSKIASFVTSQPPYGGSAFISPNTGYLAETQFEISIHGWQSTNTPVKYRVWSTDSPSGNKKQALLSNDWISADSNFTFFSTTTNPFLVEITDASQETVFVKVTATITARSNTEDTSSLISKLDTVSGQISLKYAYMDQIVKKIQSTEETSTSQDAAYLSQQIEQRSLILDQIEKDIQTVSDDKSIQNGESQVIISNTVQMLSTLTQNSNHLNDDLAIRSLNIVDQVQAPTSVFSKLLTTQTEFSIQYASVLSNILNYADIQAQQLNKGRGLSMTTTSLKNIEEINEYVRQEKNKFVNLICQGLVVGSIQQEIKTPSFNILIEKFSTDSMVDLRSFVYSEDSKSRVNVNVTSMMKEVRELQTVSTEAVCVQTTFYKVNLKPIDKATNENLTQFSNAILDIYFVDETGQKDLTDSLETNTFIQTFYAIQADTFKTNQTICMSYQQTQEAWTDTQCQTTIDEKNLQVQCYCSNSNSQYIGVFTDVSRLQGVQIPSPPQLSITESVTQTLTKSSSSACVGVILLLLLFACVTPVVAFILDRRDIRQAQVKIENKAKLQLIESVAQMTEQPFDYWKYNQEQLFSYVFQNRTLFSHYLTSIHPFFSIFSKFDVLETRLVRYSIFFLQLSLYTLICVASFGPQYRKNADERNEFGLDSKDASNVIGLGFFGMIMLLPIPYVSKFFRSTYEKKPNESNQTKRKERYQVEVSQEQNTVTSNSPVPIFKCYSRTSQKKDSSEIKIQPQRQIIVYIIYGLAALLSLIAFIMSIAFASKASVFNSYCMVASYYTGIFGSLFMSNIIRICINHFLAEKVADNNQSLLRFIVSEEAVKIVNEMRIAKEAEQQQQNFDVKAKKESVVSSIDLDLDNDNNNDQYEEPVQNGENDNIEKSHTVEDKESDDAISIAEVDLDVQQKQSTFDKYTKKTTTKSMAVLENSEQEVNKRQSSHKKERKIKHLEKANQDRAKYQGVLEHDTNRSQLEGPNNQ